MKCEICDKNEATVHLTQTMGGRIQKVHLCSLCAEAHGVNDPTGFSLLGILKLVSDKEGRQKPE
jgi:protein arginine kinase activator